MTHLAPEPDLNRPLTHQVLGINNVAYSPDGDLLATSDVQMNVVVRRNDHVVVERNLRSELDKVRPTERVRGLAFSSTGEMVFVAAADTVYAISCHTGDTVWSYQPPRSFGFLVISPVALTAMNGHVAASFDNGSVAVWDEAGNLRCLWQDNDAPRHFAFGWDGKQLVGTDSFSLCVWGAMTRAKEIRIPLPCRAFGFAAAPSGAIVAIRTLQEISVWDVEARRVLFSVPAEPGLPVLAFHPTRPWLAVAVRNSVMLLDDRGMVLERQEVSDANILAMAFHPNDPVLALGLASEELVKISLTA
jgi:WD40 repeat protein